MELWKSTLYLGGSDSPGQRPLCAVQELLTISEAKTPGHFPGAHADSAAGPRDPYFIKMTFNRSSMICESK